MFLVVLLEKGYMRERIKEIIEFLRENSLFTNSPANEKAIERFKNGNVDIKFIATSGEPIGTDICSRCHNEKPTSKFSYYKARVNERGYLARSNALCTSCAKNSDKKRKGIIKDVVAEIPEDLICLRCNRKWEKGKKWHRDHDEKTGKYIATICGNCNMSRGDQRNPKTTY